MESSVLKSAFKSATYNMILQITFRVVTFLLNALIVRYVGRDALGVMNVRLTLLYSTIMFVSRESFRRVCIGANKQFREQWQQVVNLTWLAVPCCALAATVLCAVWSLLLQRPSEDITEHYDVAVLVIGVSSLIETMAEPLYIVGQSFLFIKLKVVIESAVLGVRASTLAVLVIRYPSRAVEMFCVSFALGSVVHVVLYYSYFYLHLRSKDRERTLPINDLRGILPGGTKQESLFLWDQVLLGLSFFKQGILKQILTEGERYMMTVFPLLSFGEQGQYDVINNLGSLAARFIFLPIEEASYLYFSQALQRGLPMAKQNANQVGEAAKVLRLLLRFMLLISLCIITFSQSYAHAALHLYGGAGLSEGSGPTLLKAHCFYILFLAVNGITECYTFAAMTQEQIDRFNRKMIGISIVYLTFAYILTLLIGSVGFIVANCVNMLLRIIHSVAFIYEHFSWRGETPLQGLIPGLKILGLFGSAFLLARLSELYVYPSTFLGHISVGAVLAVSTALVILVLEKDFLYFLKKKWQQSRSRKE